MILALRFVTLCLSWPKHLCSFWLAKTDNLIIFPWISIILFFFPKFTNCLNIGFESVWLRMLKMQSRSRRKLLVTFFPKIILIIKNEPEFGRTKTSLTFGKTRSFLFEISGFRDNAAGPEKLDYLFNVRKYKIIMVPKLNSISKPKREFSPWTI